MSAPFTRIFLLRHGRVTAEWEDKIYGALDVPLSTLGVEQGRSAASRLIAAPLAAVISSGLQRAENMASLLRSSRSLPRTDDRDLRELERGDWCGLAPEEVELRWPGAWTAWCHAPGHLAAPGGESLEDLRRRVLPRMELWASTYAGRSIAIVTHGWVIRVLVCDILALPLSLAPRLDVQTGDLISLLWHWPPGRTLEGFALSGSLPRRDV